MMKVRIKKPYCIKCKIGAIEPFNTVSMCMSIPYHILVMIALKIMDVNWLRRHNDDYGHFLSQFKFRIYAGDVIVTDLSQISLLSTLVDADELQHNYFDVESPDILKSEISPSDHNLVTHIVRSLLMLTVAQYDCMIGEHIRHHTKE